MAFPSIHHAIDINHLAYFIEMNFSEVEGLKPRIVDNSHEGRFCVDDSPPKPQESPMFKKFQYNIKTTLPTNFNHL
jgi:hypothetical protein